MYPKYLLAPFSKLRKQAKEIALLIKDAWKSWLLKQHNKGNLPMLFKCQLIDLCILPIPRCTDSLAFWVLSASTQLRSMTAITDVVGAKQPDSTRKILNLCLTLESYLNSTSTFLAVVLILIWYEMFNVCKSLNYVGTLLILLHGKAVGDNYTENDYKSHCKARCCFFRIHVPQRYTIIF